MFNVIDLVGDWRGKSCEHNWYVIGFMVRYGLGQWVNVSVVVKDYRWCMLGVSMISSVKKFTYTAASEVESSC